MAFYSDRIFDNVIQKARQTTRNEDVIEKEVYKMTGGQNWRDILYGPDGEINPYYDMVMDYFLHDAPTEDLKVLHTADAMSKLFSECGGINITKGTVEGTPKKGYNGELGAKGTVSSAWMQAMAHSMRITKKHPGVSLTPIPNDSEGNISNNALETKAWGIGAIDIEPPPLHTYNGKSSPGAPEPPDETTSGNCSIYKYYIDSTIKVDQNGKTTYENNLVAGSPFKEIGSVTDYISIDEEGDYKGYDLVEWGVSTSNN